MGNGEKGKLKEFGNDQKRGNQAREGEEKEKKKSMVPKGRQERKRGKGAVIMGQWVGQGRIKRPGRSSEATRD